MSIFDGVVTFDEEQVPVILGVESDGIRLSVGTSEIGEWSDGEYSIDHRGDGVYAITAESETLEFVPNNPALFAAGIGSGVMPVEATTPTAAAEIPDPEPEPHDTAEGTEGPEPKPLTKAIFYAVVAITALLGMWAMVSLFLA